MTSTHRELIKWRVRIAVEDYLLEVERMIEEESAVEEVNNHAVR